MHRTLLAFFASAICAFAQSNAARPRTAPAAPAQRPQPVDTIDLTPTTVPFEEDGLITQRLCFDAGRSRILLRLPPGWAITGNGWAVLTSTEEKRASISIINSPKLLLPLATEAQLAAMRETILALAPKDAEDVKIASETPNATPINGWQSHQFALTYNHYGTRYQKVVDFIRLNPRQEIQLVTFTPETFAARALGVKNGLLNSWYREPKAAPATARAAAKPAAE